MSAVSCIKIPSSGFDIEALIVETLNCQDKAEALGVDGFLSPPPSPSALPHVFSLDDGEESDLTSLDSDEDDALSPITPINVTPVPSPTTLAPLDSSKKNPTKLKSQNDTRDKKPISERRRIKRNKAASQSRTKRILIQRTSINGHQKPRKNLSKKHLAAPETVTCDLNVNDLPAASTGYVGIEGGPRSRKQYELKDLVGEDSAFNFKLQNHTIVLVDQCDHTIAILAGHPKDENWPILAQQAAEALESRRELCHRFKGKGGGAHRRGKFTALRAGVSFGGGQKKPGNLCNNPQNEKIINELNGLDPFKRLAGFASSVMATWQPKLHSHYVTNMNALHREHPELIRMFPTSVFSAVSYNLGLRTVCYPHKDFGNLAYGLCAVTSLGSFDYTKSGHLILWELGLVIEFPPGSTILLPSAIVTHSNITVAKHERRYSFAQYTAGGLFRWVDNSFKTRSDYLDSLSPQELQIDDKKQAQRWEFGLSLLKTLEKKEK